MSNDQEGGIKLVLFNPADGRIHPIKFVKIVENYFKYDNVSWELTLSNLEKCIVGSSRMWAKMHSKKWRSFREF